MHLGKKDNVASDIVIYDKKEFQNYSLRNQYLRIPPRVVIEVDIVAEAKELSDNQGYVYKKTDKLLAFGVEKVICFFSSSQKVMIAEPNSAWLISDWSQTISLFGDYEFSLTQLIEKDGILKL